MSVLDEHARLAVAALMAAVFALNLATAALLAADSAMRRRGAWLLPALHVVVAAMVGFALANIFGLYKAIPVLGAFATAVSFLLAPAVYWTVRRLSFTCDAPRPRHLWHLLPAALTLAALAPYYVLLGDAAYHGASGVLVRRAWLAALLVQSAAYLGLAGRIALGDARRLRDIFSFPSAPDLRRVRTMMLLMALPYGSLLIELTAAWTVGIHPAAGLGAGIFRLVCFGALAVLPLGARVALPDASPAAEPPPPRYTRSALDETAIARIVSKLQTAMTRDALFRDSALTLPGLAKQLGLSSHKLSQVVNERLGANFYDYVNGWRVAYARDRLVAEPAVAVIDIAMDAGFNSKSTFNAAFKKGTGVTPSAWRAANRDARPDFERVSSATVSLNLH